MNHQGITVEVRQAAEEGKRESINQTEQGRKITQKNRINNTERSQANTNTKQNGRTEGRQNMMVKPSSVTD